MGKIRHIIGGNLELLSALHVGTGDTRQAAIRADAGNMTEIAVVACDHRGRPYLPGTTIKGLLRRLAEARLDCLDVVSLFGTIKNETAGSMGALLVRGAAETATGDARGMPYVAVAKLADGIFIAARTRITRDTGVADHNHLFFQEMVAPGARFRLSVVLETSALAEAQHLVVLGSLITVLAELTGSDGVPVGKGQAEGQGRTRLDPNSVEVVREWLEPQGTLDRRDVTAEAWDANAAKPATVARSLTFSCPTPFLIADSSHRPVRDAKGETIGPQLSAQRAGGLPLILGSSILGALRKRAAWIEALREHGDEQQKKRPAPSNGVVDDSTRVLRAGESPDALTRVERLFGVTGFRGLIEIVSLKMLGGSRASFTSVKIDRFSGAPIDKALFTTDAYVGTEFQLRLRLTARARWPSACDTELFDCLIADLVKVGNVLMLGHRVNAGFGWFTVKE